MSKLIVTHFNPDIDAICSVWLLKKFHPDFEQAEVVFVAAGETYKNKKVDADENIIHVDTGLGQFDHHQYEDRDLCAAKLVFDWLGQKKKELKKDLALIQLIKVVTDIDHFGEVLWPDPADPRYNFCLDRLLDGLKQTGKADDSRLITLGLDCLDGVYSSLRIQSRARQDLNGGFKFTIKEGEGIGCLTQNNEILKLGQKLGYVLVIQKDPQTEHVRIKARPDSKVDLTNTYELLKKMDPKATWYLHVSKKMLLNGSTKSDKMKPSTLSLKKVIDVVKE